MTAITGMASIGSEWLVHAREAVRGIDEAGRADAVAGHAIGASGGQLDGALAKAAKVARGIVDAPPPGMLDAVRSRLAGAIRGIDVALPPDASEWIRKPRATGLRTALAWADATAGVQLVDGTVSTAARQGATDAVQAHVRGLVDHADVLLADAGQAAGGRWLSGAGGARLQAARAATWDVVAGSALEEATGVYGAAGYSVTADVQKVFEAPLPGTGLHPGRLRDLRASIATARADVARDRGRAVNFVADRLGTNFQLEAWAARERLAAGTSDQVPRIVDQLVVVGSDASRIWGELADGLAHDSEYMGWVEQTLTEPQLEQLAARGQVVATQLREVLDAPGRPPLPEALEAQLRAAASVAARGVSEDWTFNLPDALTSLTDATRQLTSTSPGARDLASDPILRMRSALANATAITGATPRDDLARAAGLVDAAVVLRDSDLLRSSRLGNSPASQTVRHVGAMTFSALEDVLPRVREQPEVAADAATVRMVDALQSQVRYGRFSDDHFVGRSVVQLGARLHELAGTAPAAVGTGDAGAALLQRLRAGTTELAVAAPDLRGLVAGSRSTFEIAWAASSVGHVPTSADLAPWRAAAASALAAASPTATPREATILRELDGIWRMQPQGDDPALLRDWLASASNRTVALGRLATADAHEQVLSGKVGALLRAPHPTRDDAVATVRAVLAGLPEMPDDASGIGLTTDALGVLVRILRTDGGTARQARVADRLEQATAAMLDQLGDRTAPKYMRRALASHVGGILDRLEGAYTPRVLRAQAGPVERELAEVRARLAETPWTEVGSLTGPNAWGAAGAGTLVDLRADLADTVSALRQALARPGGELPPELVDWIRPFLDRADAELQRVATGYAPDSSSEASTPRHAVFGALTSTLDMALETMASLPTTPVTM